MKQESLADLRGAFVLWDHLESASGGGVESAGHWGALRFVAVVATCVGEGVQGASVGWDGTDRDEMQEVLAEKTGVFEDVQIEVASGPEVVLAWSLASSEGAAGVHSPVESDSLGVSEAVVDSHFVDVAVADLGKPAGTGEEHQNEGAYIHAGRLAGPGEKGKGSE